MENRGDAAGVTLGCERSARRCFRVFSVELDVPGHMIGVE